MFQPTPLRMARLHKGWSQAELAARVDVNQAYISQLESGRRLSRSDVPNRLAFVLGVPVNELFPPAT